MFAQPLRSRYKIIDIRRNTSFAAASAIARAAGVASARAGRFAVARVLSVMGRVSKSVNAASNSVMSSSNTILRPSRLGTFSLWIFDSGSASFS